jgi:hypothetical protein
MNAAKNTAGWLGLAKYWCGQIAGLRAMHRPYVRNSTAGSPKWKNGHNVGCTMRAPDGVCICKEFRRAA